MQFSEVLYGHYDNGHNTCSRAVAICSFSHSTFTVLLLHVAYISGKRMDKMGNKLN